MRPEARLALALALTACGAPPKPAPEAAAPPAPPPADPAAWTCAGHLVPPTGYLQETRFGDPGAVDRVGREAMQALRAKVCGADCGPLEASFSLWKTGEGGGRACAMAVVKQAAVEAWRAEALSTEALDLALARAARAVARDLPKGARGQVGRIDDAGAPGGTRVRWLMPRLLRALQEAGVAMTDPPAGWDGRSVPAGWTIVVSGTLTPRSERGLPVLELAIEGRVREGGGVVVRAGEPVVFPAAVAPYVDAAFPAGPPSDPGLRIAVQGAAGGGLCGGQRTHVTLQSDAPADVRVFDLYGDGEALLLHAGPVPAGTPVPLGDPAGFEALPVPGHDAERFLVVAGDFGALGKAAAPCRVPSGLARSLHRFEGLPAGARVAHDGFRIYDGPPCAPLPEARRAEIARQLREVPPCAP